MHSSQSITRNLQFVALALAVGFIAAAPFLTRPGLPHQTDAELHVYRAAELGHTLRAGVLYPRWSPDFYFGYGYPIFNYYAPLTYYLSNLFDLSPGVSIVGGVKAVFVLGLVIAALGAYLLGREFFGPAAGVLAAASFTFSPYVVFIDPHARGDLAEHFAVCLFPLAFYTFRRLMSGVGGRGALLGSVLTLAALVFSHNLLGLVAAVLLLAYWVWEVVLGAGRSRAGWGVLAFALAVAIIAFFWLPFLLERDAIRLDVVGPGHFDFRGHFLSLGELLAPSRILDMGATAPRHRFNLGLVQWLLALPALGALLRRKTPNRRVLLYFVLVGLGLTLLLLPISFIVWENVPLMEYLQFPWRLLGPINLMLALCAAGGVTLLPPGRWRAPAQAVGLAAILVFALPVLYPPMWEPDFGPTAPEDIIRWEQESGALGTTSTGDFLPRWVEVAVRPAPWLVESYSQDGPIDRVNHFAMPKGASVEVIEQGPLYDRIAVNTPKKFKLRPLIFYFPGWHAYVDGEEVEIEIGDPEGFITLWVPKGQHEVLIRFEDTPPRTAGWIISAAGLVMLTVALALMRSPQSRNPPSPVSNLQSRVWLGGVFLLFVIFKAAVIDPHDDWVRCTSPPGQARPAQHELRVNFGDQVELLGYDLPRQHVRSGEEFPVVLYWRALMPLGVNYQSFVHLTRPPCVLWGQDDHLNPGELPTTRWPLDKYVWDEYEVQVLPGTPPGEYALSAGIYSLDGGYRLQRQDGEGDSVVLASVEVERPRRQPRVADLGMTRQVMATFPESDVTLLGYAQSHDQVTLPGEWRVTLFWRADDDHPAARTRDLVLLDAGGQEGHRLSGAPADGQYPFEVWPAGEIVRDQIVLALVDLEPGVYTFGVTVDGGERFVSLGTVELLAQGSEE